MKAKNFRFQQTVTTLVKTRFDYKIKAKTAEDAEEILARYLDKKLKKGETHLPFKQLKPEKTILEVIPVSPVNLDQGTVVIELAGDKKKGLEGKVIYDNKEAEVVQLPVAEAAVEDVEKTEEEPLG